MSALSLICENKALKLNLSYMKKITFNISANLLSDYMKMLQA